MGAVRMVRSSGLMGRRYGFGRVAIRVARSSCFRLLYHETSFQSAANYFFGFMIARRVDANAGWAGTKVR